MLTRVRTLCLFAASIRTAQAALKAAKRKDYYKILEIPRDADEAAVKRAYYKAAKKWHPGAFFHSVGLIILPIFAQAT